METMDTEAVLFVLCASVLMLASWLGTGTVMVWPSLLVAAILTVIEVVIRERLAQPTT